MYFLSQTSEGKKVMFLSMSECARKIQQNIRWTS